MNKNAFKVSLIIEMFRQMSSLCSKIFTKHMQFMENPIMGLFKSANLMLKIKKSKIMLTFLDVTKYFFSIFVKPCHMKLS